MADSTDILLRIQTEADTSGAEAVEQSLLGVQGAAETAQQNADVSEAQSRRTADAAHEQAGATDVAAQSLRNLVAVEVAGKLGDAVKVMQELAPKTGELADALAGAATAADATNVGIDTFVATSNPFAASLAALARGAVDVYHAYKAMSAELEIADRGFSRVSESMLTAAEYHKNLAASARTDQLAETLKLETAAAAGLSAELERANRIAQARAGLDRAQSKVGGADSGAVATQAVEQAAAQAQRDIAAAQAKFEAAQQAYLAQAAVKLDAEGAGRSGKVLAEETAKLDEYRAAVARTAADLRALTEVSNLKIQTAAVNSTEAVTKNAEAAQTKVAENLKTQVDAIIAQQGGDASAAVLAVSAAANKLLDDKKITGDETAKLVEALIQFRQATETGTQSAQQNVQALIEMVRNSALEAASQAQQIAALRQQMSSLRR